MLRYNTTFYKTKIKKTINQCNNTILQYRNAACDQYNNTQNSSTTIQQYSNTIIHKTAIKQNSNMATKQT